MIYIDMDGVLADFEGYVKSREPNVTPESYCRVVVQDYKEAFLISRPIKENLYLLEGEYRLLSSLPKVSKMLEYCSLEDIDIILETLRENKLKFAERLGVRRENVIILNDSSEKKLYAKGNILYDDFPRNIDEWISAGGIGILVGAK